MATTPNMGLTVWTAADDYFNHTQLVNNFSALDSHDHSTGKGTPIPSGGIASLAVIEGKIANAAVSTAKVADTAITNPKLANGSVSTGKVADGSITYPKVAAFPKVRATLVTTGDFSIPNNTDTPIQFTTTDYNNPVMWSNTLPTRVIASVAGMYMISGGVKWDTNATGIRSNRLSLNGTTTIAATDRSAATGLVYQNVTTVMYLNASDYVELFVYQNSGGALLTKAVDKFPYLSLQWLSS